MKRRALITGITGQDGSYLTELLLEKDYEVYGLLRRRSTQGMERLEAIVERVRFIPGDVTDSPSLLHAMKLAAPHEVYNLAAQSFVAHSFAAPLHTADVTGLGALRVFEAAREAAPRGVRIYQASSAEQYGTPAVTPQQETTPFAPLSPYGCAKTFAHYCAVAYRQAYQLFIACGIAFNHESPRRGSEFVTQKIAEAVARIVAGQQTLLRLGNLAARRDWCHAQDVVRGAWMILQQEEPEDFVLASGEAHSVQEFVDLAFNYAGLEGDHYVIIDAEHYRPLDIGALRGDATKARMQLHWTPHVTFEALVQQMVEDAQDRLEPRRPVRAGG